MPTSDNFPYMILNLVGEVGEFASKVAKAIRKDVVEIGGSCTADKNQLHAVCMDVMDKYDTLEKELVKEAGDILWQLAGVCSVMGWELEDVARVNLSKLAARKEAGTIVGDGDGIDGAERTR